MSVDNNVLNSEKRGHLEFLLRNESDMCFRRRAHVLFGYLGLTSEDHLLDAGCGRGFFVRMAHQLSGCSISAIEMERELIEIAREHNPSSQIQFFQGLINSLPFKDQEFKKVIFTEVLEHIPDHRGALQELHRVMAPGAVLALSVPNWRYPFLWDPINWVLEAFFKSPIRKGVLSGIWANHERLYREEDLVALVEEAGFVVEKRDFITYFCFPFSHNLVYGLGKELLLAGLLPKSVVAASDRFKNDENSGSLLNPVNLMRAVFKAIDQLNDLLPPRRSSVIIALKLRKKV